MSDPTPSSRKTVSLPDSVWSAISAFRFYNRIPTEGSAIEQLIVRGLTSPNDLASKRFALYEKAKTLIDLIWECAPTNRHFDWNPAINLCHDLNDAPLLFSEDGAKLFEHIRNVVEVYRIAHSAWSLVQPDEDDARHAAVERLSSAEKLLRFLQHNLVALLRPHLAPEPPSMQG